MSNQYLEELSKTQGIDYRASVPAGTVLGEEEIEPGAKTVYKKSDSLMRAGKTPLPERQPLYDIVRHDMSMVPPTIIHARMSKYPGRFTTIKPEDWDENQPVPIDETCEICAADPERLADPRAEKRPKFYTQQALTLHYRLVHTMEWDDIQLERAERQRRADQADMRDLIASIASMATRGQDLPPEVAEAVEKARRRKGGE